MSRLSSRRERASRVGVEALYLAGLALLVVGVYALVVLGIGRVPTAGQWRLLALSAIAAALVAVLYQPLRRRVAAFAYRVLRPVPGPAWLRVWLPQLLESRADADVRVAPVVHSGELLGLIVVQRAAGGEPFAKEDERVLAALARQIALALHNSRLGSALDASLRELQRQADELRSSRARVVAAADAE